MALTEKTIFFMEKMEVCVYQYWTALCIPHIKH